MSVTHTWARPFTGAHTERHARSPARFAQGFWSLGAHDAGRKPTRIMATASRIASPSDVLPLAAPCFVPALGSSFCAVGFKVEAQAGRQTRGLHEACCWLAGWLHR